MNDLYEYSNTLQSPIEAFYVDSRIYPDPVQSHWHYFMEILYMVEGSANVTLNKKIYRLKAGEVIFIPPQAVHAIYTDKGEYSYYICVKFNSNRVQLAGHYIPEPNDILHQLMTMENAQFLFTQEDFMGIHLMTFFTTIVKEVRERQYGYDAYIYARMAEVFVILLRTWHSAGIFFEQKNILEGEDRSIQDIIVYIDKHSSDNIRVEDLAAMCNMSYSYFAKMFRRQYGQSCKQYIEFIRLSKVENFLLFTDYDLNYIATETGFSDCSHLIHAFRERYGTTPHRFRAQHAAGLTQGGNSDVPARLTKV